MTFGSSIRALTAPAVLMISVGLHGVISPCAAQAGSLSDAALSIETMIAQGDDAAAIAAARRLLHSVTDATGFSVTNAQLTASPATGFGVFEPRGDNVYQPDEPIYAYVEVNGFSLTPQANGTNRLLFDVSFTLDGLDGHQMTDSLIPMGAIQLDSYNEPIDGYFHLTYNVTGVVGPVRLRTLVTDRESGTTVSFILPIEFADPAAVRRRGGK